MRQIQYDNKRFIKAGKIAQLVVVKELDPNSDLDELRQLYRDLLTEVHSKGMLKVNVSNYCMRLVLNRKKRLVNIQDVTSQPNQDRVQGIYGEIALELGFITDLDERQNHNTDFNYRVENEEYIKLIEDTIWFLQKSVLPKMKKNHFTSLLKDDKAKIALHDWRAQLKIAQSFFDHKVKVPINTQHILLHCIATMSTHNEAAREFFNQRVSHYSIIGKQMAKYRNSKVKNVPALYKPKDRTSAMMWSYLGVQCTCGSWRVTEHEGFIFRSKCLDCEKIIAIENPIRCNTCAILFYKEDLSEIVNETNCPHCAEKFSPITLTNIKNMKVTQ